MIPKYGAEGIQKGLEPIPKFSRQSLRLLIYVPHTQTSMFTPDTKSFTNIFQSLL